MFEEAVPTSLIIITIFVVLSLSFIAILFIKKKG